MNTPEESGNDLPFYKNALRQIAEDFNIVSYWQMVMMAKDNEQNLVDILREHMARTRKAEQLEAYKRGMSDAAALNRIPHEAFELGDLRQAIIKARDEMKEV